jgi:hypothetical protein
VPAVGRAAPAVLPGWPVPAPAGAVFPGPRAGEAVVIGATGGERVVAAYGVDERRRWLSMKRPDFGNCDDGSQPERLQPDGTYGPIGVEGDDYWAVDRDGRFARGCTGAVLPDGTCIAVEGVGLVARRAGAILWERFEAMFGVEPLAPDLVVADAAGTAYSAHDVGPWDPATGSFTPGALIVLDAATGALRWRMSGVFRPLAALEDGVLVDTRSELVALGADGLQRWSSPLFASDYTDPSHVLVDAPRHRVYVGTANRAAPLTAFDSRTGAVLWRTDPLDRAGLLSVGRSGRVYVAVDRDGVGSLRAVGLDGSVRWELPTATAMAGAAELPDGTVALTTAPVDHRPGALLSRIDPRRAAPTIRRAGFSLRRANVRTRCDPILCDLVPAAGAILRFDLPRPARVRVRIRGVPGGPAPALSYPPLDVAAPAGTSFVRLLAAEDLLRAGRHRVEVSLLDGPRVVRRFPIVIR